MGLQNSFLLIIEKSIKKKIFKKKDPNQPTCELSFQRLPSPTATMGNMPASGVQVADECVDSYESMKQKRKYKYCIYKLSDNLKHIVVDKVFDNPGCEDRPTTQGDYGPFWDYLQQVQENRDCRYACFDIRYVTSEGGHRNKLTFIVFCPDEANINNNSNNYHKNNNNSNNNNNNNITITIALSAL